MAATLTYVYGKKQKYRDLKELAVNALDGSDYERGCLEAAQETANNCAAAIGRLLEHLNAKNLITEEDIVLILGFDPREVTLSLVED